MIGKNFLAALVAVLALSATAPAVYAQDDARERALTAGAKVDKEALEAAVKKGCMWLKSRQNTNGSWITTAKDCRAAGMDRGVTALVLLALLKGTEGPNADCIKKGFKYISSQPGPQFRCVYEVAVLILALAARYQPPEVPPEQEIEKEFGKKNLSKTTLFEPPEKRQKKRFKKAPRAVRKWFMNALKWLLAKQNRDGGWGYGMGPEARTDASNTQYVVLALHAASRCGMKIRAGVFAILAQCMLSHQEKDGPEVEGFSVPVADFDISKLKQLEKEYLDNMLRQVQVAREQGEEITPEKLKEISTSVPEIEDPYKKFGVEPRPMRARGWGYVPSAAYPMVPESDVVHRPIGSMTCSGIAALCVAKANIEGSKWYRKNRKRLNSGIRDGCAWLADNFTVTENPHNPKEWHYYHLYGLERAGILALVRDLGQHNWYAEGANYLLKEQEGSGSWPGELGRETRLVNNQAQIAGANLAPMINTCFAILFLKRATAPVVKIPEDPYTGADLFGGKRHEKDEDK